jgi:hypothetical protein
MRSNGARYEIGKRLKEGDPRAVEQIAILFAAEGSVEWTAHRLGVSARTLTRWIGDFPALAKALEKVRRS